MKACKISIIPTCSSELGRKTPWNFILLLIFTLLMGFMLGMNTSFYDLWEVALAVGVCAAITGALTLFAFQTTIDFTGLRGKEMSLSLIFKRNAFM